MEYRVLGKTSYRVSAISFGAWAIGGSWGKVDDETSLAALREAVECGVNFIDTADVYGDGRSERLIAQVLEEFPDKLTVATKTGRRSRPHDVDAYSITKLEPMIDRSLKNLGVETLDLVQLHCPPTPVYDDAAFFGSLSELTKSGKVRHWGVSVETVDEAVRAIAHDVVSTVQIIFNIFRQKPAEHFFSEAKRKNVGILARVPLASGLLAGKIDRNSQFAPDDHRKFNQHGEAFDAGETFSGLGGALDDAFTAVDELKNIVPEGLPMAEFALKWILMHDAVTCAIPGAKTPEQAQSNASAADVDDLTEETMTKVRAVYEKHIEQHVQGKW